MDFILGLWFGWMMSETGKDAPTPPIVRVEPNQNGAVLVIDLSKPSKDAVIVVSGGSGSL